MSLRRGLRVRISPSMKDRLPQPFSGYAVNGRVGVLTEEIESGAWRVAFDPIDEGGKVSYVVIRHGDLLLENPKRISTAQRVKASSSPKKRGLMGWLGG